jgi:NitT/TauT family transport system permease protein
MAGTASILVLIAAEMVGAKAGLGYLIVNAQSSFLIPDMYAGILTVSLLGLAVNSLLVALERHFSRWRVEARS